MRTRTLLMLFVTALIAGSASGGTTVVQLSHGPVPGCPLVLGDSSFNTTVSREDGALLLKMEPFRYGNCSRFKALRLITPEGKKLKPRKIRPKRPGGARISFGIGRSSGGSSSGSSTGGSVSASGGPSAYATSNRVTYAFKKGLPEDPLGSDWIWAIKTFDRCTRTKKERHILVDHLASCESD